MSANPITINPAKTTLASFQHPRKLNIHLCSCVHPRLSFASAPLFLMPALLNISGTTSENNLSRNRHLSNVCKTRRVFFFFNYTIPKFSFLRRWKVFLNPVACNSTFSSSNDMYSIYWPSIVNISKHSCWAIPGTVPFWRLANPPRAPRHVPCFELPRIRTRYGEGAYHYFVPRVFHLLPVDTPEIKTTLQRKTTLKCILWISLFFYVSSNCFPSLKLYLYL